MRRTAFAAEGSALGILVIQDVCAIIMSVAGTEKIGEGAAGDVEGIIANELIRHVAQVRMPRWCRRSARWSNDEAELTEGSVWQQRRRRHAWRHRARNVHRYHLLATKRTRLDILVIQEGEAIGVLIASLNDIGKGAVYGVKSVVTDLHAVLTDEARRLKGWRRRQCWW